MSGPRLAPGPGWDRLFPSPAQQALLRAVFGPHAAFPSHWGHWAELAMAAGLDRNDERLLPLAAPRLVAHGVGGALAARARGVFRTTRARNVLLMREARDIVMLLKAGGVETLLLKGVSLLFVGYADPGQRPMDDLDIAVRPKQLADALAVLRRGGWDLADVVGRVDPRMAHAIGLRNSRGTGLDLHCHPIYQSRREGLDDILWDAALPVSGPGWSGLRLAPEHQVLQLIAHGLRWANPPPIRWAADVLVTTSARPLDWDMFLAAAERLELTATVGPALAWLDALGFLAVPARVLAGLAAVKVSRREARLRRVLSTPPAETFAASVALNIARLDHLAGDGGAFELLKLIPPYIRARPGGESRSPLAFALGYVARHVRRRPGRRATTPPSP